MQRFEERVESKEEIKKKNPTSADAALPPTLIPLKSRNAIL